MLACAATTRPPPGEPRAVGCSCSSPRSSPRSPPRRRFAAWPAAAASGSKSHSFGGDPCPAANETITYQYQINVPIPATNISYTVTWSGPLCPGATESRHTGTTCEEPPPAGKKCFVLTVVDAHGNGTSTTHAFTMTVNWTEPDPTTTAPPATAAPATNPPIVAPTPAPAAGQHEVTPTTNGAAVSPSTIADVTTTVVSAPTTTSATKAHTSAAPTHETPTTTGADAGGAATASGETTQVLATSHGGTSDSWFGWLIALAALLVAGVGGGAWFVTRDRADDDQPAETETETATDAEPDAIGGIVEGFIGIGQDTPHTMEKPGTGSSTDETTTTAVPIEDGLPLSIPDGEVVGLTDAQWVYLKQHMADLRLNQESMPGMFVDSSGEIDDSPDPAWVSLDRTYKIELALQQAVESGQLQADVANALSELLTEEGLMSLAAFVGAFAAFNVAGGPFAWAADVVGITILLLTLGDALITLGDVLYNDVGDATNKRQFDVAVNKTASALAGLSVWWITTFVGAILHMFGKAAVEKIKGAPSGEPGGAPKPTGETKPVAPPDSGGSGSTPPAGDGETSGAGKGKGKADLSKGGVWELDPTDQAVDEANRSFDAAKQKAQQAADVNPRRGEVNCPNTVRAVDARLSGSPDITAEAQDLDPGPDGNPKGFVECNSNADLEQDFGGRFRKMSLEDIYDEIQDDGPGARGIIQGSRGPGQIGHLWNIVNIDGNVFFIDGQTGSVEADYSGKFKEYRLLRTDRWK